MEHPRVGVRRRSGQTSPRRPRRRSPRKPAGSRRTRSSVVRCARRARPVERRWPSGSEWPIARPSSSPTRPPATSWRFMPDGEASSPASCARPSRVWTETLARWWPRSVRASVLAASRWAATSPMRSLGRVRAQKSSPGLPGKRRSSTCASPRALTFARSASTRRPSRTCRDAHDTSRIDFILSGAKARRAGGHHQGRRQHAHRPPEQGHHGLRSRSTSSAST
jgi:hypothetical protein